MLVRVKFIYLLWVYRSLTDLIMRDPKFPEEQTLQGSPPCQKFPFFNFQGLGHLPQSITQLIWHIVHNIDKS